MKHRCWIRVKNLLSNELRTEKQNKNQKLNEIKRQRKESARKWREKEEEETKWEKIRSHNEIYHNLNVIQWMEIISVEGI